MITSGIDGILTKYFGRNWRTSTSGLITAVAGFISANPDVVKNEHIINVAKFITFAGFSSLVLNTKDKQVSGVKPSHRSDDDYAEEESNRL